MTGLTAVERALQTGGFGEGVRIGLSGAREEISAARAVYGALRRQLGYQDAAPMLTGGASQHKLAKSAGASFGMMLTPARGMMAPDLADVRAVFRLTGPVNLCPRASAGCAAACLSRSGHSGMPTAQRAQAVRTAWLISHPREAGIMLGAELRKAVGRHGRVNLRLNTTSDIRWEIVAPDMITELTAVGVVMYDYTAYAPADRRAREDYHLTFSAKEPAHTPDDYLMAVLASGRNVAMPFAVRRGAELPTSWHGVRVIDGDTTDERYRDPRGVVVGLRVKGHMGKRDRTGFIRESVSS